MVDDDLILTFVEETKENLQTMEEGLLELESAPEDQSLINVVFRAMHTIKGGAGLMGLTEISNVAHHLENILENLRQSGEGINQQTFINLFAGVDLIKQMLNSKGFVTEDYQDRLEDLLQAISLTEENYKGNSLKDNEEQQTKEDNGKNFFYKICLNFRADIFETGTDPLMLLVELEENGQVLASYPNTHKLPALEMLNPYEMYISWTIFFMSQHAKEKIDEIFIFVKDENDIQIDEISEQLEYWFNSKESAQRMIEAGLLQPDCLEYYLSKQKDIGRLFFKSCTVKDEDILEIKGIKKQTAAVTGTEQSNTIRVDSRKLETILNHLAEVLIAQSRVKDLVSKVSIDRSASREIYIAFEEVDKIIRRVQEEVMNTSMIPIGGTFSRFQRMARDLAREKGKEVNVILTGKETELDRKVIEQISDPLKHLIRNSIDHGLEATEERIAQGKSSVGTIVLNAFHQEGNFVIEISDDGRGIDEEAVLNKALEKGLVEPDRTYSPSEIHRFLFLPGFSTAKEVSDISGRGVGLDVVLTNINSLRGNIELFSDKGKGTKFSIRLPLTLAIIDGMMVRVGEERFIVPLNAVIEFIKAKPENINKVEGKGIVVHLRKEFIPYAALYKLLHLESDCNNPSEGILIILKDGNKKLALLVDEIIGQEQVVIKSMRDNLEQVDGIAGATILGDGKVAIILDVSSLFRLTKKQPIDAHHQQGVGL